MNKELFMKLLNRWFVEMVIEPKDCHVSHGGAMLMHGLRESTQDIDLTVNKRVWDKFVELGFEVKVLPDCGLVKGISNLDLLLGQMSVWHLFQAGFSHFSDPFLRINTILLIGYLVYIIDKKNYLHLLFFPILLLFAQSPSTDLPVIVLAMILLNEILEKSENINGLFIISIFIFIIKPTMIWAPILVFLYGILVLKAKLKWIIPGGILILLFIFKNLWTFGYPIFPISIIDFNLPWKPNAELLSTSSKTAIEKTYDLQYTYQQIQNFSTLEYIKNWFLLKGLKSVIHIGFIISLIGFSIYTFIKKDRIITIICISLFIKSILVLLFSAQYRFFLDVFFAITFVVFYHQIKTSIILSISLIGSIMVSVGLSFPTMIKQMVPSFKLGQFMMGFNKNQLIKPSYFELKNYKTYQVGNLKFNIVDGYIFSFDTPLPAISPQFIQEDLDAGIFPQQISQDIKDGFVWKKITPKQKENIENILKDWQQNMQNRQ